MYMLFSPNTQRVTKKLVEYYSRALNKMPHGLQSNIRNKLQAHPEFGCNFSVEQVLKTVQILRLCFNFRPDLGYRPGMEFLVLALMTSFFSLRKASRVLLDLCFSCSLVRALTRGNLVTMKMLTGQLKAQIKAKIPDWGPYLVELESLFFRLSAGFFGTVLSLKSLRKFVDLVVLFGDQVFLLLFLEILVQVPASGINARLGEDLIRKSLGKFQQKVIFDNLRKFLVLKTNSQLGFYSFK